MSSINTATISGNLARDGEYRATKSGTATVTFSVAVAERRKDQDGNWTETASFIDCVMFGKRAQAIYEKGYLTKGRRVMVQGKLHQNKWTTDTGENRYKVELIVDEIDLPVAVAAPSVPSAPMADDDLPF